MNKSKLLALLFSFSFLIMFTLISYVCTNENGASKGGCTDTCTAEWNLYLNYSARATMITQTQYIDLCTRTCLMNDLDSSYAKVCTDCIHNKCSKYEDISSMCTFECYGILNHLIINYLTKI